ncbi:MAG: IS21 family transposase [Candidatus Thiodiazotropha sp. 6PLUC6]
MSDSRISMRKLQEILRLRFDNHLSVRKISGSVRVSIGTVSNYIRAFEESSLSWPTAKDLSEPELVQALFPDAPVSTRKGLIDPDWAEVHQSLKRKGVTKQLLWEEYCQTHTLNAYSYAQFCHRYQQWCGSQKRSMRQYHKAGEKLFVDYAGLTVPITNPNTGEISHQAQVFVAVLGASNYTYAEATLSQKSEDWLNAHVRAFNFFGGVPEVVVPDNLKSGVNKVCRYEPDLNPAYQHLANHYQVAVIPARPYKPKDKAKAEVGVQLVERWILAKLRHDLFFTLAELNNRIRELLTELNQKPFKQLPGSRCSAFETLDQPALKPLPRQPFVFAEFSKARVHIDYHILWKGHYYSVPHTLVKQQVDIQATDHCITVYAKGKVVASHARKQVTGFTTLAAHMPERHRRHREWTPERLQSWAKDVGPDALWFTQHLLNNRTHPEQAYRACLGLLNLKRDFGAERLNKACAHARHIKGYQLKHIRAILKSGKDQLALPDIEPGTTQPLHDHHENVRGALCYQ